MKPKFKKNKELDEIIKLISKDNSQINNLTITQLEILSDYLENYKNFLIDNEGV